MKVILISAGVDFTHLHGQFTPPTMLIMVVPLCGLLADALRAALLIGNITIMRRVTPFQ